jgi:hypothetical protein
MIGGWNFIVAAYVAAAVVLGGYSFSLVLRLRREREITRQREARLMDAGRPASDGESAPR